ncbi:hypothetical protein [Vibrio ulleungensis]|uniref:Uncharacterized protein n=1 Tax=Vibrio ulleungensis TaxID=2807619 RepID=A0ABS2HQ38_9VIBR|nr:hypothetical protein [Vibrio ulleungensis]MBM7038222.1 hypothetical protein [Vibrio ulleungensis]
MFNSHSSSIYFEDSKSTEWPTLTAAERYRIIKHNIVAELAMFESDFEE